MFKRKIFTVLAILSLACLLSVPAYAQARYGLRTSRPVQVDAVVTDNAGNAMDYPVWVYGIRIFADANNSFMGVYDADTTGECDDTTVRDEIGEATQYDTAVKMYDKPIFFSDGVAVIMTTGVGFIIYGPEPQ